MKVAEVPSAYFDTDNLTKLFMDIQALDFDQHAIVGQLMAVKHLSEQEAITELFSMIDQVKAGEEPDGLLYGIGLANDYALGLLPNAPTASADRC